MTRHILILDTPQGELAELCRTLRRAAGENTDLEVLTESEALLERLGSGLPYDLVLLDSVLGDGVREGDGIITAIRERDTTVPLVAVAERGDVELAGRAIAAGATDFLVRGGQLHERVTTLLGKVGALLDLVQQNRVLGERNRLLQEAHHAGRRIVGHSPQIRAVIDRIERVASIPRPVLIVGERGTGKELIARAVHEAAGNHNRPFVAVNCAAFADALLESELFGHERGAFTGAHQRQHGKFEQAAGGTLFLDEIGHMSLAFQKKILRVVEYDMFTRVGGRGEIQSRARIITATNSDLEAKMRAGQFLRDLYDRLTFEILRVPPLRAREGDIELLANHFLAQFMQEIPALGGKRFAHSAIEALLQYDFPGNVRELKNIVERAAYRDTTNEITPEDIGLLSRPGADGSGRAVAAGQGGAELSFEEQIEQLERALIRDALGRSEGNKAKAARLLRMSYDQFRYYCRKHETYLEGSG